MISGNMVGSYSQMGKTLILLDENGNEIAGVIVDQETVFTAGDNDVRENMVYAGDSGVSIGTKNIPAYRTTKAECLILPSETFSIPLEDYNKYDYTKFQAIIAKYNTKISDSVFTDKIAINDCVYAVNSSDALSNISKNADMKSIDLNIVNNTEDIYVIHFFTYREEY